MVVHTDFSGKRIVAFPELSVQTGPGDPNAPLTYLRTEDLSMFRGGSLIVDVSVILMLTRSGFTATNASRMVVRTASIKISREV